MFDVPPRRVRGEHRVGRAIGDRDQLRGRAVVAHHRAVARLRVLSDDPVARIVARKDAAPRGARARDGVSARGDPVLHEQAALDVTAEEHGATTRGAVRHHAIQQRGAEGAVVGCRLRHHRAAAHGLAVRTVRVDRGTSAREREPLDRVAGGEEGHAPYRVRPEAAVVRHGRLRILRADDQSIRRAFERLQAHVLRRGEHHAVGRSVHDGAALVVAAGVGINDRVGD